MKINSHSVGLAAFLCAELACAPASGFFHFWDFAEFYSNADGSVQFIEMQTTSPNERFSDGVQIRSQSTGLTYTFSGTLPSGTANKRFVIATASFVPLPGAVAPDFPANPLPANFFNQAGDTLRFCQSTCVGANLYDIRTFTSIPTDNVFSRVFPSNTDAANSPRNFAGATGSINRGDYNKDGTVDAGDYAVWRKTLTQTPSPVGSGADGDDSGVIGAGDELLWTRRFGNEILGAGGGSGQTAIVPEPSAVVSLIVGLLLTTGFLAIRKSAGH